MKAGVSDLSLLLKAVQTSCLAEEKTGRARGYQPSTNSNHLHTLSHVSLPQNRFNPTFPSLQDSNRISVGIARQGKPPISIGEKSDYEAAARVSR